MKRTMIAIITLSLMIGSTACEKDQQDNQSRGGRMVMVARGSTGVGGAWTLHYYAYLLKSDGTYYALYRSGQSPEDLDIQQFKQAESASYWGTWEIKNKSLTLTYGDGSNDRTYADGMWFHLDPGKKGDRLSDGRYVSISGGGNTAWGGNIVTGSITQYWFDTQGRFSLSTSVSGGTSNITGVFADAAKSGTYEIDRHTITFSFGNGHTERRLFYYWRGGNRMNIGIGSRYFHAP